MTDIIDQKTVLDFDRKNSGFGGVLLNGSVCKIIGSDPFQIATASN